MIHSITAKTKNTAVSFAFVALGLALMLYGVSSVAGNKTGPTGTPDRGFEPKFGQLILHAGPYSTKPPKVRIKDSRLTEPDAGTANMIFLVKISKAFASPITVDYTTQDDTATAPSDYITTAGTVTFVPGDTEEFIQVPIVGDLVDEKNEKFIVRLFNATNARVNDNERAKGRIKDND